MIRCKCGHCGYEIKTYDKFAGKRVRCPKCKEALQIPQGEGGASAKTAAVIKFRCPNCDQKIGVPTSYGGKVVRCAKCKHQLRVPQAPGMLAAPKPEDDVAALRAGREVPSSDGSTMPGLGDMGDLLQLEASAPAMEAPLRLSPAEDTSEGSAAESYASQFPTRSSFQGDEGEGNKKNKLVVAIVIAAVFIVALLIGYMSVKSFTSSLETAGRQAGFDFDEAQQFTEDYITLLADGDVEAAIEKLSPEVKAITDKEQIERLSKVVGKSKIVELTLGPTHFEEGLAGNQYYLWYRLKYEEDIQVFIASVREVDARFTIDGIAAEGSLGQTVVIGQRSYDQLTGMALSTELRGIGAFLAKSFCAIFVVLIIIGIIQVISMWIVFEKADQPGWAAIVPFYNMWILAEVGDKPGWMGLALYFCNVIPVVGFILYWVLWISICIGVAQTFDRGIGFGICLSLLPFIFYPILAFSRD